jgi:hypothetical protein
MISGHNQRAETKTPSAFYDFGAAVDEHYLFGRVSPGCGAFVGVAILASALVLLGH